MDKNINDNWQVEVETIIQFNDLDPMNIVWHGNYPKLLEIARYALLSKINYDYMEMEKSGYIWPIIDMQIRYIKSASLGQVLKIKAKIVEYEYRLKTEFLITDAKTGEKITKASTVQVAVDLKTREMCFASPDILLEKLGIKK